MVTKVGLQTDFAAALKDLVELDFDAVEAYEAAINRLENSEYQERLREFKGDHERHIQELSQLLQQHNEDPPQSPSLGKQWLTKGKVVLGSLIGDGAILSAMLSNEIDTNTAYERIVAHENKWSDAKEIVERGLADERRHKTWLEKAIKN